MSTLNWTYMNTCDNWSFVCWRFRFCCMFQSVARSIAFTRSGSAVRSPMSVSLTFSISVSVSWLHPVSLYRPGHSEDSTCTNVNGTSRSIKNSKNIFLRSTFVFSPATVFSVDLCRVLVLGTDPFVVLAMECDFAPFYRYTKFTRVSLTLYWN